MGHSSGHGVFAVFPQCIPLYDSVLIVFHTEFSVFHSAVTVVQNLFTLLYSDVTLLYSDFTVLHRVSQCFDSVRTGSFQDQPATSSMGRRHT